MSKVIRLNHGLYQQYIQELQNHLFEKMSIEQIMEDWQNHHRKRRFIAMYLLQSKEIFYFYYEKRVELGMEGIFNQIISAMFAEPSSQLKQGIIQSIGMAEDMVTWDICNR
ncbi:hypothetical protein [Aneurinibacillus terranovensis]|uniref:hypothetical protein n=1 Tax=Aneurinibacillus terranovensis TaxID=278991 RepID=UPI0003FA9DE2|nr:hypothetical protein [Aneurinibacillus terranovensis]